jgi:hypothetical protein
VDFPRTRSAPGICLSRTLAPLVTRFHLFDKVDLNQAFSLTIAVWAEVMAYNLWKEAGL